MNPSDAPNNDEFFGSTGHACRLCGGMGGWYVGDFSYDYGLPTHEKFEWTRCVKCGGSGDEQKPRFPVSVSRK